MTQTKVSIVLQALDRLSSPVRRASQSLKGLGATARRVSNSFKLMQMRTAGFRKVMANVGQGIKSAGKFMTTRLTAPIGLLGAGTIKMAADFELAMNRVRAKSGAGETAMARLTKQAKAMGIATKFSATEAANAQAFLAMAGFRTQEIFDALPATLNLAAAAETDLARTADIMSNIMGAFRIPATQSSRAADVLAAVTAKANVDMEQLADTMKFAGPVADEFGATLEDTAAAAGLLGNIGIQGTVAGTALKRAFMGLAAPTSKASQMLEKMGVNVVDKGTGKIRRFGDIMTDLSGQLAKMPQASRIQILEEIFGKIGIAGAAKLAEFARTGKLAQFSEEMKRVQGAAGRMAEIMDRGAVGSMRRFKAAVEGVAIAVGDSGVLEMFTSAAERVAGWLRETAKTNPRLLKMIAAIAALTAVLGPLLIVLGGLIAVAPAFITLFTAIGAVIGAISLPVLAVVAAIGLLVFVVWRVWKNWDKVSALLKESWGKTKEWFSDGVDFLKNKISSWADVVKEKFTSGLNFIKEKLSGLTRLMPGFLKRKLGLDVNVGGAVGENRSRVSFGPERRSEIFRKETKESKVTVDFKNVPRGARVKTEGSKAGGLNLQLGYQGAGL